MSPVTATAGVDRSMWSRREFLGATGALIISFGLPSSASAAGAAKGAKGPALLPDPQQIDSWLAVRADGSVVAAVGKIEAGMGIGTAFGQIVADELDVSIERVTLVMGDTASTVDQRGTGSSNGIIEGGGALRKAGAEARLALLTLAAERLGATVGELEVVDGVVRVRSAPDRAVGYGDLLGGRRFELPMTGKAVPKLASAYRYVGRPIPRVDLPPKALGSYAYLVDFKLPNMVHGRVIRPPATGARCLGVEAGAMSSEPVTVVQRGEFVAVVCAREEHAVRAAQELRVRWTEGAALFAENYDSLYRALRSARPKATEESDGNGDVATALTRAVRTIEAVYEYPFQSHASMGPACAVADVRSDGATVWMGGQKPYSLRQAVATLLGLKFEQVRVVWLPGPGSYGMNDADDAAIDAVLLSREVGKPVRVQYTRADATGWDPKGPPITVRMRGGIDATGAVTTFSYEAFGYSGRIRPSSTQEPGDGLSPQLIGGFATKSTDRFQFSDESYQFPNKLKRSYLIPWEQSLGTGLRTAHLRDPDGMATCFASESFVDELAAETRVDPIAFRLRYLSDERAKAALRAVGERAGWVARPSPARRVGDGAVELRGRGVAYAPRNGTIVAVIAEVTVNRETGALRVTRFVVAHDCGFVINPGALVGTIEANLIQGLSRTVHEAVGFTPTQVTSVDWVTYPILDMTEIPESVEVVLLNNRPEMKSTGAGEPATRPVAAAIANAFFDATGVRLRRVPFDAKAVRAAFTG